MIRWIVLLFSITALPLAAEVPLEIEKQKLKLSLEYENYIDPLTNEIRTTGIKATYLLKTRGPLAGDAYWSVDLQTGVKTNFDRTFSVGNLSPLIWSNRLNARAVVPAGPFFFIGGFYFRNKWLANSDDPDLFVDIFGGVGFTDVAGSFQAGFSIGPDWEFSVIGQKGQERYDRFPLSNTDADAGSARLSRTFSKVRTSLEYRVRSIDYKRPIIDDDVVFPIDVAGQELQHDLLHEVGLGVEILKPFYVAATYFYQDNNSNNPGFSYTNNRLSLLIGTQLNDHYHFQAYGILQNQSFADPTSILQVPVLLDEYENNTMAASLIRMFDPSHEIELGFQRLSYNSSYAQLDTSKYILYVAYNYRF
jgi:hypothetical protein